MPTHPHQANVTRIQKTLTACQNRCLFTRISTLKAGGRGIQETVFLKVVTKSIDVMALNTAMVTRALGFLWTSYRGLHMLCGSLPKDSHPSLR